VILLLTISIVAFSSSSHAASGSPSFGITALGQNQKYFKLTALPGQTLSEQIQISNVGSSIGTAHVFPVDAHTDSNRGLTYPTATSLKTSDVGSWIKVSQSKITLHPGESIVLNLTITIPNSVRDGEHGGGIVVSDDSVQTVGTHLKIQHASIIAVYVTLPGSIVHAIGANKITVDAQPGQVQVLLSLTNKGNQISSLVVPGTRTVEVPGLLKQTNVTFGKFVPGDTIEYPLPIKGTLIPGKTYTAFIHFTYGTGQVLNYQGKFMVTLPQATKISSVNQNNNLVVQASGGTNVVAIIVITVISVLGFLALVAGIGLFVYKRRLQKTKVI